MPQITNIWGETVEAVRETNKWGFEVVRFVNRPAADVTKMLRAAHELGEFFRETYGLDLHICYGTLLGAVRDDGLIRHDDDFDLSYISRFHSVSEVIAESRSIREDLANRNLLGQVICDAHFGVKFQGFYFDITLAWEQDGFYNLYYLSHMTVPIEAVTPLKEVVIFGRRFLAPADPEAVLADIYGPQWRSPIKNFSPSVGRWNVERNFTPFREGFPRWTKPA